jgi:hypothetical protein
MTPEILSLEEKLLTILKEKEAKLKAARQAEAQKVSMASLLGNLLFMLHSFKYIGFLVMFIIGIMLMYFIVSIFGILALIPIAALIWGTMYWVSKKWV